MGGGGGVYKPIPSTAFAVSLGLILSPLKGVIRSKNLLHVAMEIVHKFRINCGMTFGTFMRGAIRLFSENPAAVPGSVNHCSLLSTLWANKLCLANLCTVFSLESS